MNIIHFLSNDNSEFDFFMAAPAGLSLADALKLANKAIVVRNADDNSTGTGTCEDGLSVQEGIIDDLVELGFAEVNTETTIYWDELMPTLQNNRLHQRRSHSRTGAKMTNREFIRRLKAMSDESVIQRGSAEGVIHFMRSDLPKICVCCPGQPTHVFSRYVKFGDFDDAYPETFGHGVQELLGSIALCDNRFEGKRVRVTVEVLEP
ncbi:MAG: hypothetical protein ING75_17295 [Rhodocyclaceae bacterium]|nr:hypothetical protein [Rhodocyclaceae bacterium]